MRILQSSERMYFLRRANECLTYILMANPRYIVTDIKLYDEYLGKAFAPTEQGE